MANLYNDENMKIKCIEKYLEDFDSNFVFCQSHQDFEQVKTKINKRFYEAPKIISDVFEGIIGAVFADGGYNETVRVLQHLLGPFVCMVAKFLDKIRKNPIEEFNLFWSSQAITPQVITFGLGGKKEKNAYDTSDEEEKIEYAYDIDEQPKDCPHVNYKCVIIYEGNKMLCKSYGNTKEQAKKNACALGFAKLRQQLIGEVGFEGNSNSFYSASLPNNSNLNDSQNLSSDGNLDEEEIIKCQSSEASMLL